MRAPEAQPEPALKVGRYAVAGVLALALSLAGLMGGYRLIGAALGVPDGDEGLAVPADDRPDCPAALQAADACDYDGAPTAPEGDSDRRATQRERGVATTATRGDVKAIFGEAR